MNTGIIIRRKLTYGALSDRDFSVLERITLMAFHPRAIFIELAGFTWAAYYFWNYDWMAAIGAYCFTVILAIGVVLDVDAKNFSETWIGRVALLHLHPLNISLRVSGAVFLLYGVWQRSVEFSLGGLSLIFLGHSFGWQRVDKRFAEVEGL